MNEQLAQLKQDLATEGKYIWVGTRYLYSKDLEIINDKVVVKTSTYK